jgi:hypothetical protein
MFDFPKILKQMNNFISSKFNLSEESTTESEEYIKFSESFSNLFKEQVEIINDSFEKGNKVNGLVQSLTPFYSFQCENEDLNQMLVDFHLMSTNYLLNKEYELLFNLIYSYEFCVNSFCGDLEEKISLKSVNKFFADIVSIGKRDDIKKIASFTIGEFTKGRVFFFFSSYIFL